MRQNIGSQQHRKRLKPNNCLVVEDATWKLKTTSAHTSINFCKDLYLISYFENAILYMNIYLNWKANK